MPLHSESSVSFSDRPAKAAYLVVRDGDKWKDVFRLTPGQVMTIGRAPTNRIVIRSEMSSRNHCEIFQAGPMWILRDLGSRNGTTVDGHRISGDWELEVLMPERRIGHVRNAQGKIKTDLDVCYILATDPGTRRKGKVKEIHDTTQMHEQEGHTVRIRVELEQKDVPTAPRPGASTTAEVQCGRASIGYVYLHEFIEFVQGKVLFNFF